MTKLAILSDIHGNSIALKAVLTDLDALGGADHIIVLGDLAAFGPDPNGVLSLLQSRQQISVVRGHTDRCLIEAKCQFAFSSRGGKDPLQAGFFWTAQQLGHTGLRFLANLPARQLLHVKEGQVILAVHGSPRSDEENISLETSDIEFLSMSGNIFYDLLLCAHTHIPFERIVTGRRVINAGSVGLPFDGDRRASYAVVHLEAHNKSRVEFRRVAYDVERVIDDLLTIDHPTATMSAYDLRAAQPLTQRFIHDAGTRWPQKQRRKWSYPMTNICYIQTPNTFSAIRSSIL
ncbi:MAG: metallophosphoesterase family protein [Chloroflexota bacterium]